MRVTFIYVFNLVSEGGHPFEDTTDHTEIPEMCLIEADGDDVIDIMQRFLENVHFGKNMFINGML